MKPITFELSPTGCHICTSHSVNWKGYPLLTIKGKHIRMNRYIYEKHYGPIPAGYVVCHSCDNRRCINPEHLHLGTPRDNIREAMERHRLKLHCFTPEEYARRRKPFGTDFVNAKLNNEAVHEIRATVWKRGDGPRFAKKFGVSLQTVMRVRRGEAWPHVK